MKKLVLLVMTLTMVATSGCLYGRRITVNHQGMEAINQSQKESQAVLDECQNQVQAASQAIADNPRANVKTCGLEYQGTPPEALKVQNGIFINSSSYFVKVKILGQSQVQPTTGMSEKTFHLFDLTPGAAQEVPLYPGLYQVILDFGSRGRYSFDYPVDSIDNRAEYNGKLYNFRFPIVNN